VGDGITVLRPDQKTADMIGIKARYYEDYLRQQASPRCAKFYVLMERIGRAPQLMRILSASTGSAQMMADIDRARVGVEVLAKAVAGLDSGAFELVAWTRDDAVMPQGTDYSEFFDLGVWPSGAIAKHGEPGSMQWVPIPVLVRIAGIAITAAGAYFTSLYLSAKKTAEEADYLRAQTESLISKGIAEAPPADRAGLASAFAEAQRAAQSAANQGGKGWLSSLGQGLGELATAAVQTTTSLIGTAESWLPWVLGGWAAVSILGSLSNLFGGGRRCCD
jgi:hypothetical protein